MILLLAYFHRERVWLLSARMRALTYLLARFGHPFLSKLQGLLKKVEKIKIINVFTHLCSLCDVGEIS